MTEYLGRVLTKGAWFTASRSLEVQFALIELMQYPVKNSMFGIEHRGDTSIDV